MKKRIFTSLFLFALPGFLLAQGAIDNFLKGSVNDAKTLVSGYSQPMLKAFGTGLNQGWYNTAKPHKFPGADLTLTVTQVNIPSADKFYQVDNTKLNNVALTSNYDGTAVAANGKANVPTFFGPTTSPTYSYKAPLTGTFSGAPGVIKFLPVPIANLGIGLPKGFDLKFRYVPTIDLSKMSKDVDGKFNLFGVGIMHDVKQYIPGIKNLPFDLSAFVGYTSMKLDVGFDSANPDQRGVFESKATTIQALISKKVAVLTIYGGVGYNMSKTTLSVKGQYDFDGNGSKETSNPLTIDGTANGARATAGLRLKLAVFAFHADYTLQKYKTLSFGFGINVR